MAPKLSLVPTLLNYL